MLKFTVETIRQSIELCYTASHDDATPQILFSHCTQRRSQSKNASFFSRNTILKYYVLRKQTDCALTSTKMA